MRPRWILALVAGMGAGLCTPSAMGQQQATAPVAPQSNISILPSATPTAPAANPNVYAPTTYSQMSIIPTRNDQAPADTMTSAAPCATQCCADHFVPYMLGDFASPVGTYFFDLKVAEGASPRPIDRVFLDFNYYDNLGRQNLTAPLHEVDLYRYVFGFEKTFLDGKASVEVRVPFFTLDAQATSDAPGASFTSTYLGNISAIGKYVVWENKETGSLISAGAILTVPTAATQRVDLGPSTMAFVAPFVGYILSSGDFYLQGFSSIIFPVARPQSIVLFNDIGVGYFAYRDASGTGLIRSVAPTFEVHVMTPLRQPNGLADEFGIFDTERLPDIVDLTFGATIEFSKRTTLGLGVCTPVTGPKPFDVEAIAQLNVQF
jgi:hypothetical protein